MKKKLLCTLLSLISVRAVAAEVFIKFSDRILQAKVEDESSLKNITTEGQLIELLKNSEVTEVILSDRVIHEDEVSLIVWTEPRAGFMAWTEPR